MYAPAFWENGSKIPGTKVIPVAPATVSVQLGGGGGEPGGGGASVSGPRSSSVPLGTPSGELRNSSQWLLFPTTRNPSGRGGLSAKVSMPPTAIACCPPPPCCWPIRLNGIGVRKLVL